MAFKTRIRAVRFKSGGEVRVLPSVRETVSADLRRALDTAADKAWAAHEGKIAGFALVAWTTDGDVATTLNNSAVSPHPSSVLPTMCADSLRRVLTNIQINRTLGRDDDEDTSA